jgi:predicted RNA-binding Zn-ribbon protein involved in translation (DUF1610 family)
MSEKALWLDGNGLAGLLVEVFGAEMTAVRRRCQSCGQRHAIGSHRWYRGAGDVLRCPNCGDVALRICALPDRYVVEVRGTWRMAVPRE